MHLCYANAELLPVALRYTLPCLLEPLSVIVSMFRLVRQHRVCHAICLVYPQNDSDAIRSANIPLLVYSVLWKTTQILLLPTRRKDPQWKRE